MAPTWEQFQHKHVLDPNIDKGFSSYTRAQWNEWFGKRLPTIRDSRHINSVIISVPKDITNTFQRDSTMYEKIKPNENFYWSNQKFPIYFMRKTPQGDYNVYYCGSNYFLAKLEGPPPSNPIHFHGQNLTKTQDMIRITESKWRKIE